jgi:hypothetical protein
LEVHTIISEEHTASIFRVEVMMQLVHIGRESKNVVTQNWGKERPI